MIAVAFLFVAAFAFVGGMILGYKMCQRAGKCETSCSDEYSSSDTVVIVPAPKKRRGKRKK